MSWWNIFKSDVSRLDSNGLPEMTVKVPMPKVKPPRGYAPGDVTCVNSNISEPVLSFVECVRKDTKRFVVDMLEEKPKEEMKYYENDFWYYEIMDKHTKDYWVIGGRHFMPNFSFNPKSTDWMTKEEQQYAIKQIVEIYKARKWRKEKLESIRKDRRNRTERNRLKRVYCTKEK